MDLRSIGPAFEAQQRGPGFHSQLRGLNNNWLLNSIPPNTKKKSPNIFPQNLPRVFFCQSAPWGTRVKVAKLSSPLLLWGGLGPSIVRLVSLRSRARAVWLERPVRAGSSDWVWASVALVSATPRNAGGLALVLRRDGARPLPAQDRPGKAHRSWERGATRQSARNQTRKKSFIHELFHFPQKTHFPQKKQCRIVKTNSLSGMGIWWSGTIRWGSRKWAAYGGRDIQNAAVGKRKMTKSFPTVTKFTMYANCAKQKNLVASLRDGLFICSCASLFYFLLLDYKNVPPAGRRIFCSLLQVRGQRLRLANAQLHVLLVKSVKLFN